MLATTSVIPNRIVLPNGCLQVDNFKTVCIINNLKIARQTSILIFPLLQSFGLVQPSHYVKKKLNGTSDTSFRWPESQPLLLC